MDNGNAIVDYYSHFNCFFTFDMAMEEYLWVKGRKHLTYEFAIRKNH
jgi:hypothetical protein